VKTTAQITTPKSLEETSARNSFDGEDLLDVTPIALEIRNRTTKWLEYWLDKGKAGASKLAKRMLLRILRPALYEHANDPRSFLDLCENLPATNGERIRLRNLPRQYEKSLGVRSNTTKKGRAAVSFLEEYEQSERSNKRGAPLLISPLIQALRENDFEFFENLATAMRFRERRETAIAQARRARRAITAAAIFQGRKESLTWLEARDTFWPEYNGDAKNFQRMLDQCGFAFKRGKIGRPRKTGTKKDRPEVYPVTPMLFNAANDSGKTTIARERARRVRGDQRALANNSPDLHPIAGTRRALSLDRIQSERAR
jgi:hypothetical protein